MARPVKGTGDGETSPSAWLPQLRTTAADAKARADADADQRKAAGAHPKSVILTAKDVQEGKYDAGRLLETTLGMGKGTRPLTTDDLAAFRRNVKTVAGRYVAGIRARQVLDLSLSKDRERANEEIKTATPVAAMGGRVRFLTPASGKYKLTHHHVIVEFMSFSANAVGSEGNAKAAALRVRREPLKIECDCGRWRYWYRYIATIGKYNAGRDESGFPKIRNPNLHGVACKHILRVMAEVESSPAVLSFLERLIRKARDADDSKVKLNATQAEAKASAEDVGRTVREADNVFQRTRRRAQEKAAILKAVLASKLPQPATAAPATRAAEANPEAVASRFGLSIKKIKGLFSK